MAHIVGSPRPDIVVSKDVSGGPALLFDTRAHERVDFSDDATAILDVDPSLRGVAVELARANGVYSAADEVELGVRIVLGANASDRREAERAVLETLADIAVREWFEAEKGRQ
jgi:hypothetical protein